MPNTNETVTIQLVVAADGALQTLNRFDTAMTESANASVRAGAGLDAFNAQLARQRAAMEAGIPVLKARTEQMSVEERMLNATLGRADAMARARIAAERDIARAVASTSNLVIQGKMTEEAAIRAVTTVEQAHVTQINRMIAAQREAATATTASAAATQRSAAAIQSYNSSASRNAAESANIAMQFQDIAVSAQMGMSPMMVALQQGTQLSAVFNQMRNPLQALPAAFMAIVNPVSLLTIGLVALSTIGIQWAMDLFKGAEDATTALENHKKMLDQLLAGYGDLRDAATEAIEAAQRLPQGVIESDLQVSLKAQEEALDRIAEKSEEIRNRAAAAVGVGRASGFDTNIIEQLTTLATLNINIESTAEQLDAASVAARELYNTATDSGIKEWADEFFQLTNQVRDAQAIIGSIKTVLEEPYMTDLSGMMEWSDITAELADWHTELEAEARRAAAAIQASYQAAIQAAQGYGEAAGAANVYAGSLARLQALIPAVAAAQQAQNLLAQAQIQYDQGRQALLEQQGNGLARDVFAERMSALTETFNQARDAVTGLTAVQEEQDRLTRQNSIEALSGKEQALARVNEQYRQQEEAIKNLLNTGASQEEVDVLLAQNDENRDTALGNAGTSFDNRGGGRGGRGGRGGATGAIEQQREAVQNLILDLEAEREAIGLTAVEQEKLAAIREMGSAATDEQKARVTELIQAVADERAAAELLMNDENPFELLGQQMAGLEGMLQRGAISWQQYGQAAQQAHMLAASTVLGGVGQITGAMEQLFQGNKAFAVANAVINTAQGITAALALPPPMGWIQAAAVAASGAAQIATIMSTQRGSSSRPSVGRGGGSQNAGQVAAPAQPSTTVNLTLSGSGRYSRDEIRDLFDQMAGELKDGVGSNFKVAVTG